MKKLIILDDICSTLPDPSVVAKWFDTIKQLPGVFIMGILDLDMDKITDPNDPVPADTKVRLKVISAELTEADTGSAGVNYKYAVLGPKEHQGKQFPSYVNIQKKDGTENNIGTWHVKNLALINGVKKGKLKDLIPAAVGAEFDAILDVEPESGEYSAKNKIKRILK